MTRNFLRGCPSVCRYSSQTAVNYTGIQPVNATAKSIDYALPEMLAQLEVPSDKVAAIVEGVSPVYNEALMYLLSGSNIPQENPENDGIETRLLHYRNIFEGILIKKVDKVPKVVTKAYPDAHSRYLATYDQVKGRNPGHGSFMTCHLMYFLCPIYGNFPVTAKLVLHFSAIFLVRD
ncbi:MAG: hypothetical protein M1812_002623 [Candelaria pacifica]|nr:MAG: hypothetical protein M1812_002623 [Candelaria pacifica]